MAADRDTWRQQAQDARDEAAGAAHRLAAQDAELSTARSRLEAVQVQQKALIQALGTAPACASASTGGCPRTCGGGLNCSPAEAMLSTARSERRAS